MTPRAPFRKVVLIAAGLTLAGCGGMEPESGFEGMARRVAAIEVSGAPEPALARAETSGLRGARPASPLKVEVLDVHDFWDARDAGLRGVVQRAVVEAAPEVAGEAVRAAAPAVARTVVQAAADPMTQLQLGAFSSEASARAAWAAVSGRASGALEGREPILMPIQIDGRRLVRLRVEAPADAAALICAAAQVQDQWCRRAA